MAPVCGARSGPRPSSVRVAWVSGEQLQENHDLGRGEDESWRAWMPLRAHRWRVRGLLGSHVGNRAGRETGRRTTWTLGRRWTQRAAGTRPGATLTLLPARDSARGAMCSRYRQQGGEASELGDGLEAQLGSAVGGGLGELVADSAVVEEGEALDGERGRERRSRPWSASFWPGRRRKNRAGRSAPFATRRAPSPREESGPGPVVFGDRRARNTIRTATPRSSSTRTATQSRWSATARRNRRAGATRFLDHAGRDRRAPAGYHRRVRRSRGVALLVGRRDGGGDGCIAR